jgi:SAM-dependent methyltransferase
MLLVDLLRPKLIVELGTYYGDSYCAFCQAVKHLGLETQCYAVDTWQGDPQSGSYGPEVLADLREYHDPLYRGFSQLVQSTFDEALGKFEDGTIDLLHIDGWHTYEAVKHDFESWFPKVGSHGVILFHDTAEVQADFGVKKLWDEMAPSYPHFEFIHGHGLGVLSKGEVRSPELRKLFESQGEDAVAIRNLFSQLGRLRSLSAIAAKDWELRAGEDELRAKDAEIASLKSVIYSKDAQIQQTDRGIAVQLVKRYEKVVERVMPIATRRRAIYELPLSAARVILNEGWRSFWPKFKQWLRQQTSFRVGIGWESDWYQQWIAQNEPSKEELPRLGRRLARVKVCLNLGCGNTPFCDSEDEKWINIDIGGKADLFLDVRHIGSVFSPNSVDYVFCCHLLEHLVYREGDKLLQDIYNVLKDGGVLELHLPELGMIIANQDPHIEGIYGGQLNEYDVHKSGWDYDTGKPYRRDLKKTLTEKGFTILRAERHKPAQICILCSKGETSQRLEWRKTWAVEVYDVIENKERERSGR